MNKKVAPWLGTALSKLSRISKSWGGQGKRKIILHYHLFKNAGTSIDHILKQNFGERHWHNQEFPGHQQTLAILSGRSSSKLVEEWLHAHPDVRILSSHTAVMPLPNIPTATIFPIVFVRHPLIRLQSSFAFERQQFHCGRDTISTRLAAMSDFSGYLRGLLAMKNHSLAHNFNAVRLAAAVAGSPDQLGLRAFRALDMLPFVGVVELFERSMLEMERWLRPHFPRFKALEAWQNATRETRTPPSERLDQIRKEIGDDLFDQVTEANHIDIEVHKAAYAKLLAASPSH